MEPEINPPGRPASRKTRPPAVPMTSVFSVLKILARLGHSNGREAVICFTPPYRKSARGAQLRPRHAAMRAPLAEAGEDRDGLLLVSRGGGRAGLGFLHAFAAEFLALLA